ncbi:MAG: hypothetical protein ACRCT6_09890, partial [Notoacmeibacter sp.]
TGVGGILGLTKQGEIKQQLAGEAAADAALNSGSGAAVGSVDTEALARIEGRLQRIEQALINIPYSGTAQEVAPQQPAPVAAPEAAPVVPEAPPVAAVAPSEPADEAPAVSGEIRTDTFEATLAPNQGVEVKLIVKKGDKIEFNWASEGGVINYDYHGRAADGSDEKSFEIERGVSSKEGTIEAPFDGQVGWFFRNRGAEPVKVQLNTSGNYSELKQTM